MERTHSGSDIEKLENIEASEIHPRRTNAKELLTPQRRDFFIFPKADGTAKCQEETTNSANPL